MTKGHPVGNNGYWDFKCHSNERKMGLYLTKDIQRRDEGYYAHILVQVTIYRRLRIGRDDHLDQSEAYDIS